ncbi:hypothetical protein SESBI_44782 [Sesbania bispinosa]|nr:hypothetical protein SESBI_44782 [Sesbania bispinosa]
MLPAQVQQRKDKGNIGREIREIEGNKIDDDRQVLLWKNGVKRKKGEDGIHFSRKIPLMTMKIFKKIYY